MAEYPGTEPEEKYDGSRRRVFGARVGTSDR